MMINGYIKTVLSLSVCGGASATVQTTGYHCGDPGSLEGNQTVGVHEYADGLTYSGAMDFPKSPDKDSYFRRHYNGNGALTEDEARGISLIEYDAWGNPRRIQFDNGNITEYVFTATGTKLRTVHYTAVPNISVPAGTTHRLSTSEILSKDSTDYHGNLIVENGKPDKYLFAGGFASLRNDADGKPEIAFHYYDQDHLGNNRAVVSARTGAVEQITNYYPFGMPYTDQTAVNPDFQKYKYNGKELDKMHGLNTYDYGARQYYSIVPAWDRIDPMCEKYYDVSPYAYCGNNPIQKIDRNRKWSDIFTALLYWSITSNSSIQYNRDAKSNDFKWTINVFSQDENGDFIITNYHSFNKSLKENASKTLDKKSQNINEISVAASALGDGAEKGALVTAMGAPEVSIIAATIGVAANKVGTVSDFVSKSLKITSSIFKGHVDEHAVGDLMYSAFTIGTSTAFQKRLKPLVKELFPNISKKIEATVYDQIQKLMEDGRK